MTRAFLAIGSNLGDLLVNCETAVALLKDQPDITVTDISPWYRSKAVTLHDEKHPDYCNGVLAITTELFPEQLLTRCQHLEAKMGRTPKEKWQPRLIDFDLLLYGSMCLTTPNLLLPHPELTKRIFVLQPLCDIAPDILHPREGRPIRQLLKTFQQRHPGETLEPWRL